MKGLDETAVILLGVLHRGKTPTCLYLAMQYKVLAANCPLTEDDFLEGRLPEPLKQHKGRLFGLSISPKRLHQIWDERRPGSSHTSLAHCRIEIGAAERLFRTQGILYAESTNMAIEELAVEIMQRVGVDRLG